MRTSKQFTALGLLVTLMALVIPCWAGNVGPAGGIGPPGIGAYKNPTTDAPTSSGYFVIDYDAALENERKLQAAAPITLTDNGPNGTAVIGITNSIAGGLTGATTQQGAVNNILGFTSLTSGDITYYNGTNWVRLPKGSNGDFLTLTGGLPVWSAASAGAPSTPQYIVSTGDAGIPNADVLTAGTGITVTNGTNLSTVAIDSTVTTNSGSQILTNKTITSPVLNTSFLLEAGANDWTFTWAAPAAARAINFADPGGDAGVVMTEGALTINGLKTFSDLKVSAQTFKTNGGTVTVPTGTVTLMDTSTTQTGITNKEFTAPSITSASSLVLKQSSGNYTLTWDNPATNRALSIPDPGATAKLIGSTGTITQYGALYAATAGSTAVTTAGSSGQPLVANTGAAPGFGVALTNGGGTGLSSYTQGDLLYYSTGTALSKLPKGTALQTLRMNAGATAPEWATGGSGTVTDLTVGNLSPLFTSNVATSTTTPAVTYTLSSGAADTIFGRHANSSGAPTYGNPNPEAYHKLIYSGGRLTLVSGAPEPPTANQSAKTNIYLSPYGEDGCIISIYDGTRWVPHSYSEITEAVPATTATMYSVWASWTGSAVDVTLSAWTNDTTPGAAGAVTLLNGIPVSNADNTKRFVGVMRTTAVSGQTQWTASSCFLGNVMNLMPCRLYATDTTNSWTYATTGTIRAANGNTTVGTHRTEMIQPLEGRAIHAAYHCAAEGIASDNAGIGIVLNATNAMTAKAMTNNGSVAETRSVMAEINAYPAIGYNYIQDTELGDGTFYGDNGAAHGPLAYQTVEFMN